MVFVPIEAPLGYREKKTGLHLFKRVFSRLLAGQPDAKPQVLPLLPHHGFFFSNLLPGILQCLYNFCFRIAVNCFHSGGKLRCAALTGFPPVYGSGIPEPRPLSFGFTPSPPLVIFSHISRDNLPCGLIYCLFVIRFSSSFPTHSRMIPEPVANDSGMVMEPISNLCPYSSPTPALTPTLTPILTRPQLVRLLVRQLVRLLDESAQF